MVGLSGVLGDCVGRRESAVNGLLCGHRWLRHRHGGRCFGLHLHLRVLLLLRLHSIWLLLLFLPVVLLVVLRVRRLLMLLLYLVVLLLVLEMLLLLILVLLEHLESLVALRQTLALLLHLLLLNRRRILLGLWLLGRVLWRCHSWCVHGWDNGVQRRHGGHRAARSAEARHHVEHWLGCRLHPLLLLVGSLRLLVEGVSQFDDTGVMLGGLHG